MKFDNINNITGYILSKVSEEQIFAHYLGISITDITESLGRNAYKIKNPHRADTNPSVSFKFNGRRVKMLDYGSSIWRGDCFHIAGLVLFKDCNKPADFMYILNHIINTLIDTNTTYIANEKPTVQKVKRLLKIDITPREFNEDDYKYFNQFHIRNTTIDKSNVNAVDNYYLNDTLNFYKYSKNDPCYAYFIDNLPIDLWKLYFPFRKKDKTKFITNNPIQIESFRLLKPNKNLILTKSNKDKLLLKQVIKDLNIHTVEVGNVSAESVILPDTLTSYINARFPNIFTLFDVDSAGIDASNYFLNSYKYKSYLESNGITTLTDKDLTDTSRKEGYLYIMDLILTNYNRIYE